MHVQHMQHHATVCVADLLHSVSVLHADVILPVTLSLGFGVWLRLLVRKQIGLANEQNGDM